MKNFLIGWLTTPLVLSPILIMNLYEFRANNLAAFIGSMGMLVAIITIKYRHPIFNKIFEVNNE